jgi:RsiW-degrading membrane proteinase PrsW (M82 family)
MSIALFVWILGVIASVFYVGMYCAERDIFDKESFWVLVPCFLWPIFLIHLAGWIYKKYTMSKGDL